MALQYVTPDGTLIVPGAYATYKVAPNNAGLAATGVLFAVGESDAGPSYAEEGNSLYLNAFGPDQKADVVSKYASGALVDAYNMAVAAMADDNIPGAFNRMVMVKTNTGVKSSSVITSLALTDGTAAGSNYGTLLAKLSGKNGNLISRSITAAAQEILPTTGPIVLASPSASTTANFRVNGGAIATASLTTGETPAAIVAAIDALTGVAATGGVSRGTIISTGSVVFTHDTGMAAHVAGTFLVTPTVGDTVLIPTLSAFTTANEGTYVVVAATSVRIDLYKVLDAAASTTTAPTTETVSIGGATDLVAYSPAVISLEATNPIAGLGKSLEIADTSTGAFSSLCYVALPAAYMNSGLPAASIATFVSKSNAPHLITPTSEYVAQFNLIRQVDGTNQTIATGGDVILTLGYVGTTASAVIAGSTMTITLTGGVSSALSPITVNLGDFTTVADLCQYLSTIPGFTAAPALSPKGAVPSINLDDGTYTFATDKGVNTGRIKADGYFVATALINTSTLVNIYPPGTATKLAGLPQTTSAAFLSGGSRGATLQSDIQGAFDALQNVRGNFLVPLFSNDSAYDISNGTTDASSSYSIASILASARAHCLQMSTLKRGKPRQAFLSVWDTFLNDRNTSSNLNSARCVVFGQGCKDLDANGSLRSFGPWATAVKLAAGQAAGGYRDMTGKFVAISGLIDPPGYNNQSLTDRENALLSGLCVLIHEEDGGYTVVSDQTTYTADSNFIFNSFQAIYAADTVASTAQKNMERAFKGQSLADVSASTGLWVLGNILDELKAAKFICPSDDAPKGYKNLVVKVVGGNAMVCSGEIKVSTGIKFIPISFLISAVQQSAQG